MRTAQATLTFDADNTRHFTLPANGTPSLIFIFTSHRQLGARAYSGSGQDFAPGTTHTGVRLDFWADDEWTDVVIDGAEFSIWYGGTVGSGVIDKVL